MRTEMEDMLASHTNRAPEQVREDIERDKILTAEDALAYGFVDQITASRKTGVSA